ncbi:MAG: type II CAAX prenyl endopeptidase Rce1 family protein [Chthoniobacterales bacterium]
MRPFLKFIFLTVLVSWSCFVAAAAMGGGTLSPPTGAKIPGQAVFFLGVIAPSLVALALTARSTGRRGVVALLRQTIRGPTQIRWYVFAAGYMAVIKLAAAGFHRIWIGEWPAFGSVPVLLMVLAMAVSTPVQAGEEIGWRGYALPHLTAEFGLARASIAVGVVWALWHLPLFLIPGSDTYHQSFVVALLGIMALSVAMAWVYWRTNGSLFITMLMHAAVNNTTTIVPSSRLPGTSPFTLSASVVGWLTVALLWICAAYFVIRMRSARLQPAP